MTTLWICILVVAAISFTIKGAGPALLGSRPLPKRARSVVALLAPALLGALVLTELLGPRWQGLDLAVVAGVAAAVVARLLRVPLLLAVLVAVAVTAGVRLLP